MADFLRGSGDSFGLANARRESPVEGAERHIGSPDGDCSQAQVRRDPVGGLAGVRRQHLAAADLAARREPISIPAAC